MYGSTARQLAARFKETPRLVAALAIVAAQVVAPSPVAAADASVDINSTLSPAVLEISPGTTVTWTNSDSEEHRVRSQTGPEEFDSGNLATGESFSFTFATAGTYTYIDDRDDENPAYHGTVIVSTTIDPSPGDPGDPAPPPAPAPPAAGDVTIIDRSFSPTTIEVAAGGSVTWANNDGEEHTVTANDISWDSGIFDTGGTFTRTFQTAGSFGYFCLLHPDMTGTVVVTGSGGSPAPEPPAPDPVPPPGGEPSPPPTDPPPPSASDISIVDFGYEPGSLTVSAGSTITWSNTGAALHTVTAIDGSSDSGFLFAGDTYTKTFSAAGSFSYFCTLHPEMTGTITITAGAPPPAGSDPPPASTPPVETPPAPPPAVAGSGDVNIVDNSFGPATITVSAGATLSWLNKGALPHTVTARNGAFDSGLMLTGDRFNRTFATPGTYSYFCAVHPEMTGTVLVTGADGQAPPEEIGDDTSITQAALDVGPSSVRIVDNGYEPGAVTVGIGQSVSFANAGALPHTVTDRQGAFDSGILMSGETFTFTPTAEAEIQYFCTIHPEMAGTIIVTSEVVNEVASSDEENQALDDGGGPVAAAETGGSDELVVSQSVRIVDLDYDPQVVTVEAGEGILWRNMGELPHTVTDRDGAFDSGILQNGETFTQGFAQVGTYEYFCTLHPEMVATVEVVEAAPDVAAVANVVASPPSDTFAYVLAGGLLSAMIVFVVGMTRFVRTVESQ